jgi:multidrug efflux pump subunit AcrA (membrane-fusion protein)
MSETVSQGRAEAVEPDGRVMSMKASWWGRFRWVVVGSLAVLVAGGAASAWQAGAFRPGGPSSGNTAAPAPATYIVSRQDISSTTPESATLGYAASYTVTGQGGGTLTWLPSQGQVIAQGQVLYEVDNGTPVVLLQGSVPDWRDMSQGTTGADVSQLNHDLVDLGYASSWDISALGWDYYSWATSDAVAALEEHLGVADPPGSLSLGSVVFEPEALRVSQVTGSLGGPASGPIFSATSDRHVVTISLSTSMEGAVAAGDAVTVTLPDGSVTPGVVTSVGTVASGSVGSATIPVYVQLTHPGDAGTLDQAPVTVNITTSSASNVLVVEVEALLAQPAGGYAVEVVGAGNTRRLVSVTVGLFDDANGLVQVTGNLTPGERVVVPAT